MKKVVVVVADGFEEIEAITVIDVLRRASVSVEVMGLRNLSITGGHGITITCDDVFDYYSSLDFDGVALVGGMNNAITLSQDEGVLSLVRDYASKGKMVAGICATPALVFSEAGILEGKQATCYPSDSLMSQLNCEFKDNACVVCGNIITSQSPDTAMEFALTILQYLGLDASSVYRDLQGK